MVQVEGLEDGYFDCRKLVLEFSLGLATSGLGFGIQRLWKVFSNLVGDQQPTGACVNRLFNQGLSDSKLLPQKTSSCGWSMCVLKDTRRRSTLALRRGKQNGPGCALKARPILCVSGQEPVQSKVDGVVITRRLRIICSVVVLLKKKPASVNF